MSPSDLLLCVLRGPQDLLGVTGDQDTGGNSGAGSSVDMAPLDSDTHTKTTDLGQEDPPHDTHPRFKAHILSTPMRVKQQ